METMVLLSLFRMIEAFRASRRTHNELEALSDRELLDIGLRRWEIPGVAKNAFVSHVRAAALQG